MKNSEEDEKQETKQPEEEEEEKARCEWDFSLSAVIYSSSSASDAIGVVEFDPSGQFLATGGIARKIRIYSAQKSLTRGAKPTDQAGACEFYICAPAKLSSLKWRPGSGSRALGSGDYDGVVMEYDLERRVPVFERDEHGGRRVWSMDYSHCSWGGPTQLGASGSDDGTMQMWDPRCRDHGDCLAAVRPGRDGPSPVCCVEFDPFGGALVTAGCADRRVYGYDLRRMVDPVLVLDGHEKAVTYTKFLDSKTLVSSSVDGCLMMWSTEGGGGAPMRTYRGHVNGRRFVGLSVWGEGGLISCGSEDNQVFVYDKRWGQPIWVRGGGGGFEQAPTRCEPGFISGVCWRQTGDGERCMLVAGGSDGVLQAFEGERKVINNIAG